MNKEDQLKRLNKVADQIENVGNDKAASLADAYLAQAIVVLADIVADFVEAS